jgi:small subunit ribosomal protein S2
MTDHETQESLELSEGQRIITVRQLLEAGVHFGHRTERWNPAMKPYIYGARNGIHIIDLQQTAALFRRAFTFIRGVASEGKPMLFVGTKKQAQDVLVAEATARRTSTTCAAAGSAARSPTG